MAQLLDAGHVVFKYFSPLSAYICLVSSELIEEPARAQG